MCSAWQGGLGFSTQVTNAVIAAYRCTYQPNIPLKALLAILRPFLPSKIKFDTVAFIFIIRIWLNRAVAFHLFSPDDEMVPVIPTSTSQHIKMKVNNFFFLLLPDEVEISFK